MVVDRTEVAKLINRSYRGWIAAIELEVEEVVHEVCVALMRRRFDPSRSSRSHFILLVARSVIKDMGRSKRRHSELMVEALNRSLQTKHKVFRDLPTDELEALDLLRAMAEDVGPELVPVLVVLAQGGHTVDVSKQLDMPQPAARAAVARVRERLSHWVH